MAELMRGGEAYTWSSTSVKEKVGLSARGFARGGGAYRRRNVICSLQFDIGKEVQDVKH